MVVDILEFPSLEKDVRSIEEKYCELLNRYRSGDVLMVEELDWMDSANVHLITTKTT